MLMILDGVDATILDGVVVAPPAVPSLCRELRAQLVGVGAIGVKTPHGTSGGVLGQQSRLLKGPPSGDRCKSTSAGDAKFLAAMHTGGVP